MTLLPLLLAAAVTTAPIPPCRPAVAVADFAAPPWRVLAAERGDLDGDGRRDAAVVLAHRFEDHFNGRPPPRWLVIALRGKDGRLHPAASSPDVVGSRGGGGLAGDPFRALRLVGRDVLVTYAGGSGWRWAYETRFRHLDGRWRLASTSFERTWLAKPGYAYRRTHDHVGGQVTATRHEAGHRVGQRYFELRAPWRAKPVWDGPGVALGEGLVLRACRVGGDLHLEVRSQGPAVKMLRVVDGQGRATSGELLLAPVGAIRARVPLTTQPGGVALRRTGPWIRASVEAVLADGRVRSTSGGGRHYPGVIRWGDDRAPALEDFRAHDPKDGENREDLL